MIRKLTHVIHTPESLRLPLRIRSCPVSESAKHQIAKAPCKLTNEIRQPKRAILKRLLRILGQNLLHFLILRALHHLLRFLVAACDGAQHREQVLRRGGLVPVHPRVLVEE